MDQLPLKGLDEERKLTVAPAWVAFVTAWGGMLMLVASVVFVLLPGSRNPVAELQHQAAYSIKDRFLPVPIYGITVVLFLGIVVLWQMRKEPHPLADGLAMQRVQVRVGMGLALVGAIVIYGYVWLYGPRS